MEPIDILTRFFPNYTQGLLLTVQLAGIGALIAAVAAPFLAAVKLHAPLPLRLPVMVYVSFVRGTPLLAQLFLVYYGSGQFRPFLQDLGLWGFFRDPYNCALLTFAFNSTAYQVEILRGGLKAVPHGEVEAAHAVGMGKATLYRRVILPHCYRIAWPALGNEIILLVKASALASVVTLFDLMGQTRLIFSKTFDLSAYLWAAVIYLALATTFVWLWRLMEIRLSPQLFRKNPKAPKLGKTCHEH